MILGIVKPEVISWTYINNLWDLWNTSENFLESCLLGYITDTAKMLLFVQMTSCMLINDFMLSNEWILCILYSAIPYEKICNVLHTINDPQKPKFQYILLIKSFYFKKICIYPHDNAELQQITDE